MYLILPILSASDYNIDHDDLIPCNLRSIQSVDTIYGEISCTKCYLLDGSIHRDL